jgi:hypothetical protein
LKIVIFHSYVNLPEGMIKMNAAIEALAYLLLRIEKTSVRTVWVSNIEAVPGRSIACEVVLTTLAPKLLLLTQPDAQKGTLRKSSAKRKTLQNFSGDALKCSPCYSSKPMQNDLSVSLPV